MNPKPNFQTHMTN